MRRRVDGWYRTAGGLRQASVRSRSTAAAVIVVAVAMMLGAAALLLLLQRALITEVSDAAEARVAEVAQQVSEDGTAGLTPALAESTRSLADSTGSLARRLAEVPDRAAEIGRASCRERV